MDLSASLGPRWTLVNIPATAPPRSGTYTVPSRRVAASSHDRVTEIRDQASMPQSVTQADRSATDPVDAVMASVVRSGEVAVAGRTLIRIGIGTAVVTAVGLGVYLAVAGVDKAASVAGVLVGFVELAALILALYGLTRERRHPGRQTVSGSLVTGTVDQVRGVEGAVRIRHATGTQHTTGTPSVPAGSRSPATPTPAGDEGQSVTGTAVGGHLDQVDGVRGDVEITDGP
jgi:hypothetical protein